MNSSWQTKAIMIFLTIWSISCEVLKLKVNNQENFNLTELRNNELNSHNAMRNLHGSSPLIMNETLNKIAQNYADFLAKKKILSHSKPAVNGSYGENLYKAWGFP
jgi:uncharacterized protein YkwD